MKFIVPVALLALQYAVTKSWNADGYSEETCLLGWLGHLRRLSLVFLMLLCVALYYIPESRPHVRRACCGMIDLVANGLKSALAGNEPELTCGKTASNSVHGQRSSSSLSLAKHGTRTRDEAGSRKRRTAKTKVFANEAGLSRTVGQELLPETPESRNGGRLKESWKVYLHSVVLKDLQRYLKFYGKRTTEDCALMISDQPQVAMTDKKYEDDGVVILHDNYPKARSKECATSTGDIMNQRNFPCDQHAPTKDRDKSVTGSYTCRAVASSTLLDVNDAESTDDNPGECPDQRSRANRLESTSGEKDQYKSDRKRRDRDGDRFAGSPGTRNKRRVNFAERKANESVPPKKAPRYEGSGARADSISGIGRGSGAFCAADGIEKLRRIIFLNENEEFDGRHRSGRYDPPGNEDRSCFRDSKSFYGYEYGASMMTRKDKPALYRVVNWIFGGCPEVSRRGNK